MPRKQSAAGSSPPVGTPGPRAGWSGTIRFGLVAFSVQGFNAQQKAEGLGLHLLHAKCHHRIRYEKVCPVHGPVSGSEIVSGYEYAKGQYVEIERGEIDALRTQRERSLAIDTFVDPGLIDPIYFDGRMYLLAPDGADAVEPYAVFLRALADTGTWGLGPVVFSGKEQLATLRPYRGVLHMALLNFVDEMRDPTGVVGPLPDVDRQNRTVKMAEQLIRNWTEKKLDLSQYHDEFQRKVHDLIEAKARGRKLVAATEDVPAPVINLFDALERSVSRGRRSEKPLAKSSRSAAKRRPRRAS